MSDKPKILTVAEIDALAQCGPDESPTPESFASLCRMARAMARVESEEMTTWFDYATQAWRSESKYGGEAAGASAVEAIEATEEP